ncbi:MAG TPA: menaquinone biosynthesis decarboxylase [Anaeromyxobacter sp.]|nr:menaquinone biosynthesis decarboxylase [Anaeromyxobacter sp.]HVO18239.1 menaquinone biosynthesis decarboxylase [Anaeromyxobacter sp.]
MAYRSLREFLDRLERAGDLVRVRDPVDPVLEMAALADRAAKQSGPALLFEAVASRPGSFPVAMNLFGTRRRTSWALSCDDFEDHASELRSLLHTAPPASLWEKLKLLPRLGRLASLAPRHVSLGSCQEVVLRGPDADLGLLPALTTWPHDGGSFLTLPQVITRDPDTGARNVGMYRLQILGPHKLALHWQLHKTATAHYRAYRRRGERMPVAVALGGDPALTYCASAPLPPGVDEYLFAGFLRGEAVRLVKGVATDLEVPAEADLVIEGWVDPAAPLVREGPFGDHTGFYSLADDYPWLDVAAVTHRRDPVYPATVVGPPPAEDFWMGTATARLFLPLLQLVFPEIVDLAFPAEGVFHNLCLVSMRKEFPGHAKKLMHGLWGSGQLSSTKTLVVFDEDVDVQDASGAAWRALANIDARRDLVVVEGPVDVLDHAAPQLALGSKVGVDATRKWAEEGGRQWPEPCVHPPEILARMDALYERLVPGAPKTNRPRIPEPAAASWTPRKGAA